MSIETLTNEALPDEVVEIGETDEMLVEEISIDGLCGVY
jgi:mycofactocin precursor